MRRDHHHRLGIADNHVTGEDWGIAAADWTVDLDRLVQGKICRSCRAIMVDREGELLQFRRVPKPAVSHDSGAPADHQTRYQDRPGRGGPWVFGCRLRAQ